ncbi:MAG: ATP-binding protein [Bacillota bacterium]
MTLDEMRKIVSKDPETQNLSLLDIDIYKVYQYLLDRDQHMVKDGYQPVLRTDPYIEIVYRPTKEKAEELRRQKIKEHLKFYDSEVYIQDASLSSFEVYNEEREKAYKLSADFIENYRKDKYVKGLYIYGKYSTGKSYLLSAIAQTLAEKNISVLFVYMPDLVRSIRQGMNEGNLEQRINQLKQADVLMMDDMGGENMSSWFRDEILVPVMQYRLSAQLPVFMTSNFEYVQLVEALTVNKDEMNRVKAVRLIQRLKDLMTYVKLTQDQYKG